LITIDALRADHTGFQGKNNKTTPNLNKLTQDSVVFTEAYSNGSHTGTSFPAIFSSSYASMYGGHKDLSNKGTMLAEAMKKSGFSTAGFHSNPYLSKFYHYDKGFNTFYDSMTSRSSRFSQRFLDNLVRKASEKEGYKSLLNVCIKVLSYFKPYEIPYDRGEYITQKALNWLRGCDSRFFLWIHYMDAHWPWIPPLDFLDGKTTEKEAYKLWWKMLLDSSSITDEEVGKMIELYDYDIGYMDHNLGIFINELNDMGLYDDSVIVVTSDHGEEFNEHGDVGHHNFKLYKELVHIPLVIRYPKGAHGGKVVDDLICHLDLAPTILKLVNVDPPENWIGSDLALIINCQAESEREGIIIEGKVRQGHNIVAYRTRKWNYIIDEDKMTRELYDLKSDPYEKINLSSILPDKVDEFEAEISKHLSSNSGVTITLSKT